LKRQVLTHQQIGPPLHGVGWIRCGVFNDDVLGLGPRQLTHGRELWELPRCTRTRSGACAGQSSEFGIARFNRRVIEQRRWRGFGL